MSACIVSADVTGEVATPDGLVAFSYKAGATIPEADGAACAALVAAGLASEKAETPKKAAAAKTDDTATVEEN